MDDVPIIGTEAGADPVKQFIAQYGAPAYLRRAQQTEQAFNQVVERCRQKREEWLPMVRIHLGLLVALAGEWDKLRELLANDQIELLRRLHEDLAPRLRVTVEPTSSVRALRRVLRELTESLENFNRRWAAFLPEVDLTSVNELRERYNRYYVLEKECAVRSAAVARQGFRPLPPATVEDIAAVLPPLPVPQTRT
jgi:hypothetical protein